MSLVPARARVLARALCLFGTLAGLVPLSVRAAAQVASAPPPASAPAASAREREQQRRLLQLQQRELEQRYAGQRSQCMQRFLVFDCLDAAARHYRDAHRALRDRQQALDLLDRQERAEQERARVRANLAAREPVDPARVRAQRERRIRLQRQAGSIEQQRAASAASAPRANRANRARAAAGARGALPVAPSGNRQALQGASQARAAQAERQQRQEAYQRLQQRVQEQQRRGSPPAPPLPVPPASGPLLPLR